MKNDYFIKHFISLNELRYSLCMPKWDRTFTRICSKFEVKQTTKLVRSMLPDMYFLISLAKAGVFLAWWCLYSH